MKNCNIGKCFLPFLCRGVRQYQAVIGLQPDKRQLRFIRSGNSLRLSFANTQSFTIIKPSMNQIPSKLSPVVAVGIATLLGMSVYSMRTAHSSTSNKAQDKRELGLRGAGIGGNKNAGGPEFGTNSVERKEQTTAPKSELPSGGVGGGEGKGGTSARAVELHTRERSQVCFNVLPYYATLDANYSTFI